MKKKLWLWLLAFSLIIATIFGFTFLSQTIFLSDYIIYDDFKTENTFSCVPGQNGAMSCENSKWQWTANSEWQTCRGTDPGSIQTNGFHFSTPAAQTILRQKLPFSLGNDLKFRFSSNAQCGQSKIKIGCWTTDSGIGAKTWNVEMIADDLDSTKYAIVVNGDSKCEQTMNSLDFETIVKTDLPRNSNCGVPCSDDLWLEKLEYRLPYNCPRGANDVFATETFRGGQTIDLYSTRYPVKSFCLDAQAIITAPEGIDSTGSIYDKLKKGVKLDIPLDQTWTLFYYFDNTNKLIPNTCDYLKEWYNVDTSACVAQTGIYHICSEGVWDSNLKGCLVEAPPIVQQGAIFYSCPDGSLQTTPQCVQQGTIVYNCNGNIQNTPTCEVPATTLYNCNGVIQSSPTCSTPATPVYSCNGATQTTPTCVITLTPQYNCNGLIQQDKQCLSQGTPGTPVYFCGDKIQSTSECAMNATPTKFYNCNGVISQSSSCEIFLPVKQMCKEGTIDAVAGTCLAPGTIVCPEGYSKKTLAPDQFSCEKQGKLITLSDDVKVAPELNIKPVASESSLTTTYLIIAFVILIVITVITVYAVSRKK